MAPRWADGAESMREALTDGFAELPDQLRRSLTWDRGKELARPAEDRHGP